MAVNKFNYVDWKTTVFKPYLQTLATHKSPCLYLHVPRSSFATVIKPTLTHWVSIGILSTLTWYLQ